MPKDYLEFNQNESKKLVEVFTEYAERTGNENAEKIAKYLEDVMKANTTGILGAIDKDNENLVTICGLPF